MQADWTNFPVKSINMSAAYPPAFYMAASPEGEASPLQTLAPVTDLHPVMGVEVSDGGFVLVGKGVESDGSSIMEAFAVKLSAAGKVEWAWKSGVSGNDAANAVQQVDDSLLVVGWRTVGGVGKRCITKLKLSKEAQIIALRLVTVIGAGVGFPQPGRGLT